MQDALRLTILDILSKQTDMTLATLRTDGYPQATTVSFASDGLDIFFGCSPLSQKAGNIAHNDKISLTVTPPYTDWNSIRGLSLGGRAKRVTDEAEIRRISGLFFRKFPYVIQYKPQNRDALAFYRIVPEFVTVLDYTKGFGHSDTVTIPKPASG